MIIEVIKPRFCETDALGHINNTRVAQWFEGAREPIFKLFTPDLDVNKWKLILAKTVVEFHLELKYGSDIEIKTSISRIGNSSFDVYQEAWQGSKKCASGTAVMVHYNYEQEKAEPIPELILQNFNEHFIS